MSTTDDMSKQDQYAYKVFWKGGTAGFIKEVDPSGVQPSRKEKKMTPFGDMVLDRVWRGVTGDVKTILHQTDLATIKTLCPWWTSGPVPAVPANTNFTEYANAGPLLLHPFGLPDSVTDFDTTFVKAFPIFKPPKAGGDWREMEVNWSIYPDASQLVNGIVVTHYFGAPPTA